MNIFSFRASLVAVLACGTLGIGLSAGGAALAQVGGGRGSGGLMQQPQIGGANAPDAGLGQQTARPRAVGLPGAQPNEESVAPADRPASDMGPTEALFDAINRGDAVAARGAINRGADMRARSALGFTPVELAVDLGRKDIAFLLLSMRGMDGRAEPRPNPQAAAQSAAEQARQAKLEAQRQEAARRAAARVAPTPGPVAPQGPRLFAGDGGAAQPDAGFLGFGGGADGAARPRTR